MARLELRESAELRLRALPAPHYLSARGKRLWEELVASAPIGYWSTADVGSLCAYIVTSMTLEEAARAGQEARFNSLSRTHRRLALSLRINALRTGRGKSLRERREQVNDALEIAQARLPVASARAGLLSLT
jgi:hypothetical protein